MDILLTAVTWTFAGGTVAISAGAVREFIIGHVEEAGRQTAERAKRLAVR